jgi:soluble lytic murein transglycosylase-like protein
MADGPRRPTGAGDAARLIEAALTVITDREATSDEIALAGHVEQLAVREVSTHPRWTARVLERLPRRFREQTRLNVEARHAFRSMHPTEPADLADELPAWRILRPAPASDLKRFYREAERRYGVDWEYLAAINLVETAFGRIRGTSVAGAQGPMQFLPGTWDMYGQGGDVNDPHDAILAAARLLQANGFGRDKAAALRHYNNSSAYVRGVSLHARVMRQHPRALLGYHAWQVYYLTVRGSVWLEEGYAERRPVPVDDYLEQHPEALP